MKIKINETFDPLAGSEEFHNEEGILQEAAENIIPPAFNRLVDYAKLGAPPPAEANLPGQPGTMSPEELQAAHKEFVARRIRQEGLKKPAQDTFAQLIVRYIGRSFQNRRGNSIDFAVNPSAVSLVFTRAFIFRGSESMWWEAYRKNVIVPKLDAENRSFTNDEDNATWQKVKKEVVEPFTESFDYRSETGEQWTQKGRKMAADGASAQELLIMIGQQYKSYMKTINKWFKRNPEFAEVKPHLLEAVRRQWNRWQGRLIQHSQNNFRKIAEYIKEDDNYQEINALIKKYPSRNKVDPDTRDIIERDSLYHINEKIDNELLKKQLDICPKGWTEAYLGNEEGDSAPCILHKYDDGFFWWNRKASSCDIAGEEMANCGASNYDDSTLLILKEFVQNDSMDVMDKVKGRVMVEYNDGYKGSEFVQVLGFANSMPDEKYWEKIKDLYENLKVDNISEYAFQHLARTGRTTEEEIENFLAFMRGEEIEKATPKPKDFDEFLERVKDGHYSVSEEDGVGGSMFMNFRLNHQVQSDYSPLMVGGAIETTFNVGPESDYPSVDMSIYKRDSGDLAEFLAEAFPTMLTYSIRSAFSDFDTMAGGLEDNLERVKIWTGRIRLNKLDQMTDDTEPDRLQVRVPYNIEIPPEFFTNEDLRSGDEVDLDSILDVFQRLKRAAVRGAISNALYNTIQMENAKVNPEGYTEFIPGVDDQPEGEMVLNVDEVVEEMRELELAATNGVPMDRLQDRLEVLYRSLVSDSDRDGYLIIDQLNDETKMRWARFIADDDFWSDEFERIYSDSQDRTAAMRAAERDDGPDEEERNWRPGMPTPGLRTTDYEDPADIERIQARRVNFDDRLDQMDADEYEQRRQLRPNPGAEQVGDAIDLLVNRGNMLLRFFASRTGGETNNAQRALLDRFRQHAQEAGVWEQWWSEVPDDHPFRVHNMFGLQESNIMVEIKREVYKILGEKNSGVEKAHMNENNDIRKGGVLPFKKEEGEFYFLLGQAPQGWWSDFRGGEEPEDGGDLRVTAAREFREESSFELSVTFDDAVRLEDKNSAVYLVDLAEINVEDFDINKVMKINKGHLAGTPEIVAVQWYHINDLPQIPKTRMPIIAKALELLTAPEPTSVGTGMAVGRTVGGDSYTPFLNENKDLKTLHVFDFDDTIAFTETFTIVTRPDGVRFKVGQKGLDKILKKYGGEDRLRELGFDLDFSGFKTVDPSSRLNAQIKRRIVTCCQAGGQDPSGDFYVITARSRAAEDSIHQYLTDNGIEIPRKKVIGVEGKSKGDKIKSLIVGTDIENVTFYDDSENNIQDVAKLRQDPDLQGVSFELYKIDKQGNIPKKPMQETIYERKRYKISIGAK